LTATPSLARKAATSTRRSSCAAYVENNTELGNLATNEKFSVGPVFHSTANSVGVASRKRPAFSVATLSKYLAALS
jgi:hypothetical protein